MRMFLVGLLIAVGLCSGCVTPSKQGWEIISITNPDILISDNWQVNKKPGVVSDIVINYARQSADAPTSAVLVINARVGNRIVSLPELICIALPDMEGTISIGEKVRKLTFLMQALLHAQGVGDIGVALFEAVQNATGSQTVTMGRQLSNPVRMKVDLAGNYVDGYGRDAGVKGDSTERKQKPEPAPAAELKDVLKQSLYPKDGINRASFSRDGKWILAEKEGFLPKHSRYALFASDDGRRRLPLDKQVPQFGSGVAALSPDSTSVALLSVQTNGDQHIHLYRLSDWSFRAAITNSAAISSCSFQWMPDGKSLLLQKSDGSMTSPKSGAKISLLDIASGQCAWAVKTAGPFMVISRDGEYIACATGSPKHGAAHTEGYPVQIISTRAPSNITAFVAHKEWIASLAISPDSSMLASGGADSVIKLWSLPEGKLLHTFEGHEWTVNALQFAPDGKTVVSGSEDRTIRFWDVEGKVQAGMITLSNAPVVSVDIAPDGRAMVIGAGELLYVCDYAKVSDLAKNGHVESR